MNQISRNAESGKGIHLAYSEMKKIETYKSIEDSNRKIVNLISCCPQTINNAFNTNSVL